MKRIITFTFALAALATFAGGLPYVVVKPMGRVIRLGTSGNYHYERMDCVSSFWAWDTTGGVIPPTDSDEYRRIFNEYAEYLDADVDFRVTFDKPVAAGSVLLYGYIDTGYRSSSALSFLDILEQARGYWNNVSVPDLAANEPMYAMQRAGLSSVNYGHMTFNALKLPQKISILEGIQRFNCALKNGSPANIGTTALVECVLTVNGERVSIGGFRHTILADPDTNWINAHVPRYESMADLASTNVVGGSWAMESGSSVSDIASLDGPGVLHVDADNADLLLFSADNPSGESNVISKVTVDASPFCVNSANLVAGEFMRHDSALTLAEDGTRTNWYCVAREDGTNKMVRLTFADGSDEVFRFDIPYHVETTAVRLPSGGSVVSYSVDGRTLYRDGQRFIPISVEDVHCVGFANEGRIYGVYGNTVRRNVGGTKMRVK